MGRRAERLIYRYYAFHHRCFFLSHTTFGFVLYCFTYYSLTSKMDFAKKSDGYKEIFVEEEKQFLTATESDGSWEGNEKTKWREGTQRKPQSRVSKFIAEFRRFRWLIDVALLIINISLSFVLLRAFQTENSSSSIQVGGDFSGTGLDCEFRALTMGIIELTQKQFPPRLSSLLQMKLMYQRTCRSSSWTTSSQRGTPCYPVCLSWKSNGAHANLSSWCWMGLSDRVSLLHHIHDASATLCGKFLSRHHCIFIPAYINCSS
jgi:hypothetical protein